MYVTGGTYYPKPGKESLLQESIRKFGEAQRKHKGLIMITGLKDETKGHNWAGHLDYKGNTSLQLARP